MWLELFGGVDETVFYVFAAVAALNVVLALAILIVGCCFRSSTPGTSMDINITFGGLAIVATVLFRGIDPTWIPGYTTTERNPTLQAICEFYPALITFGLLWFIGGILMKTSAIFHYFRRNNDKSPRRFEWLPHLWLFIIMVIDVIIVLVWIFRYRPQLLSNPDAEEENFLLCAGPEDPNFQLAVSVIHGVLLVVAAIIIWLSVHMARGSSSSYETALTSVIIYNTVFVAIGGTIVFVLSGRMEFDNNMVYAIVGGLTNYAVFAAFLFLLIGKVVTARREQSEGEDVYDQVDHEKGATNRSSSGSGYLTSPGSGQPHEDNFPY